MKSAVDIGSNSIRLMIVDDNHRVVFQTTTETKLGEGLIDGILTPAAIERTLKTISDYQNIAADYGVKHSIYFGTSAVRDSTNKAEFLALAKEQLGIDIQVLSGTDEAKSSFLGAVMGFDFPKEKAVLIDIGGGSTEIGYMENGTVHGKSLALGAVRAQSLNLSPEEIKKRVQESFDKLPLDNSFYFIGDGGTSTTAAAVLYKITEYTREAVHGREISYSDLEHLTNDLGSMTVEERRKLIGMPPKRAEIIVYGLDILLSILNLWQVKSLHISDWGIIDYMIDSPLR